MVSEELNEVSILLRTATATLLLASKHTLNKCERGVVVLDAGRVEFKAGQSI
jgi:hypothetical protein